MTWKSLRSGSLAWERSKHANPTHNSLLLSARTLGVVANTGDGKSGQEGKSCCITDSHSLCSPHSRKQWLLDSTERRGVSRKPRVLTNKAGKGQARECKQRSVCTQLTKSLEEKWNRKGESQYCKLQWSSRGMLITSITSCPVGSCHLL